MHFAGTVQNGADWAASRGGTVKDGVGHFSVDRPTDIAGLLDAAARDGLEVIDVTLRRPNLESVFLQLTGRICANDCRHRPYRVQSLRRDRGAFLLSFILPIAFFSIFAVIYGGMGSGSTARVSVLVVDEDGTAVSARLVRGLCREPFARRHHAPATRKGQPVPPVYTAATAEAAVKQGVAPAALIVPKGFGANPIAFGSGMDRQPIRILHDSSDPSPPRWSPDCSKRW